MGGSTPALPEAVTDRAAGISENQKAQEPKPPDVKPKALGILNALLKLILI